MPADPLLDTLPDLVLLLGRDGRILSHTGGRDVAALRPAAGSVADTFEPTWSAETADLLLRLVRRSLSQRSTFEARFHEQDREYVVRVSAQGPDRASAVIHAVSGDSADAATQDSGSRPRPELDRRGFLRRFKESLSMAALREQSLAVSVMYIDGVPEIAQVIASRVSEQIMSAALLRLSAQLGDGAQADPSWYLGQLGDNVLAMVIHTSNRDAIEGCVSAVAASLREPLSAGGTEFRLRPHAGVAVMGLDASSPKVLLNHARDAAAEARRGASTDIFFHSDTMELRALARLDMARELREAIANGDVGMRYIGRYELLTNRLITAVGYMRWQHPLRGDIRPAEFLRVAETTGLAVELSRAVLKKLCDDYFRLKPNVGEEVGISFGALRDHLFHEEFLEDIDRVLAGGIPADRFELRISESVFVTRDPADLQALHHRGVRIVVDEVGRDLGSIPSLARAAVWGLQLDRSWFTSIRNSEVARKICRAGSSLAEALGLTPIATGVDDRKQHHLMLGMGYRYGTGDLYPAIESDITEPRRVRAPG